MHNVGLVIVYSLLGGIVSLLGGIIIISKQSWANRFAIYAMPFAAGALLAAVFLDLLKDGLAEASANAVLTACMIGLILFFFAERFLTWFHHHHQHGGQDPATNLIVVGNTIHNALDGVAIAAAFLLSVPSGIITTIAVAAHEIPHEIGDFGLLLAKGMSRKGSLIVNIVGAWATVVMAALVYTLGSERHLPLGVVTGLSAGFLLYIAASDIIPEIHENSPKDKLLSLQPLLLVLGVVAVALAIELAHRIAG
jgi:zinc and cadmium transporter